MANVTYDVTLNLEASIIEWLVAQLVTDGWVGVSVEKSFAKVYGLTLPVLCVRAGDADHTQAEIGSNATTRSAQIFIDVFGDSDVNRLNLKDWLISKIKSGMVYYEYVIANGSILSKVANGRINITKITDASVNFDMERGKLSTTDAHRHLVTLEVGRGVIEA